MQQQAFIAGAAIVAALGAAWLWSRTGGEGPRLPAVRTAHAAEPVAPRRAEVLEAPTEARASGIAAPAALGLPASEASLVVRVVERGSRRPLPDVHLVVYETGVARAVTTTDRAQGDLVTSPRSDSAGTVRFDLPAGAPLRLAARGASAAAVDASLVILPLAPGEERTVVVPLEVRADVPLHGLVVDDETGAPIAAAELRLRDERPGPAAAWSARGAPGAVTDELGRFVLARPAGSRCTIQVDAAGYGPTTLVAGPTDVGGEAPRRVGLVRAASLEVRVHGALGGDAPLVLRLSCGPAGLAAGAEAFQAGPEVEWMASVSPAGVATVRHLPADAALAVELLEGDLPLYRHPRRVRLTPGEQRILELDLGRGLRLSGRLTTPAGVPVPSQELWLVPADRPGPVNLASRRVLRAVHARVHTDELGQYVFDGLTSGEWWVGPAPAVEPQGDALAPIGRWFHAPGELSELTLDLVARPGAYLTGRVLDEDDEPVGDAALTYRSLEGDALAFARSRADGSFRLGPIGPGVHEVVALADRARGHAGSDPVLGLGGGDPIHVRVHSGTTLRVSGLVESEGRLVPIVRALATRLDGGAPTLGAVHRSAYGETTITLGPVEPGTYSIAVATRDGHCGVLVGVEVRLGERPRERLVSVLPGGRLALRNRGEGPVAVRVLSGGSVVEAATLNAQESAALLVPAGEVDVEVEDATGVVRTRAMRLRAGQSSELVLPLAH